jgi:hypothetical protein
MVCGSPAGGRGGVLDDDIGGLCGLEARVKRADSQQGERTADDLRRQEQRHRGGAMPAKVSLNIRPKAIAGLAKLVELVNQ